MKWRLRNARRALNFVRHHVHTCSEFHNSFRRMGPFTRNKEIKAYSWLFASSMMDVWSSTSSTAIYGEQYTGSQAAKSILFWIELSYDRTWVDDFLVQWFVGWIYSKFLMRAEQRFFELKTQILWPCNSILAFSSTQRVATEFRQCD